MLDRCWNEAHVKLGCLDTDVNLLDLFRDRGGIAQNCIVEHRHGSLLAANSLFQPLRLNLEIRFNSD
jgi:hypothetical protein